MQHESRWVFESTGFDQFGMHPGLETEFRCEFRVDGDENSVRVGFRLYLVRLVFHASRNLEVLFR